MPALRANSALAAFAALAAISLGACRKKTPDGVLPPAPSAVSTSPDNGSATSDGDRAERERLERERAERERALAELRRTMTAPIYFGFDRSDLTAEARETLEAKWAILSANPSMSILIEGHADELGSDEYNLALGQRRAVAAKRYLTQRDIDARRIEITSFGEEGPSCQDATEECRARNRRGEFRITSGEPAVTQR
jgi:peptidoglycan-associated lipoprotein